MVNSFVQIVGSIGGVTFSRCKSGFVIRRKTVPVKRSSSSQTKVQDAYTSSVNLWNLNKSNPSFLNSWNNFADYPQTGFNAFVRINWYHFFNNVPPLLVPPG